MAAFFFHKTRPLWLRAADVVLSFCGDGVQHFGSAHNKKVNPLKSMKAQTRMRTS